MVKTMGIFFVLVNSTFNMFEKMPKAGIQDNGYYDGRYYFYLGCFLSISKNIAKLFDEV